MRDAPTVMDIFGWKFDQIHDRQSKSKIPMFLATSQISPVLEKQPHQQLVLIMISRFWVLLGKLSLGRTCETPAESLLSLHFAILPFYIWRRRAASKTLGRPQICELGPETTRWLQYCYELLRARITRLNTGPGHWSREHQ